MSKAPDLRIAPGVTLPLSLVTSRVAVLGISGAGKTYTALKIAELLLGARQQVVVLDPGGVAWGLRAGADGRPSGGLSVIILGGEHGDVPLEPDAGAMIADLVVDECLSLVLDLSDFESDAAQQRFATGFAQRLYRRKARHRDPLHLVIDEADEFAPQRAMPDQARMLGAFQTLARRGRARGLGCTFVTQRPAEFHKSCLTQCSLLVAMRMTGSQDIKAIDDWIRHHHADEHRTALMESIAKLEDGDAWFWSPPVQLFKQAHVAKRATFDSSRTPEPGRSVREPRGLADIDIAALGSAMAETVKRTREADPVALRKRIVELERQVADRPAVEAERVEVSILTDADREVLNETRLAMEAMVAVLDFATDARKATEARMDIAIGTGRDLVGAVDALTASCARRLAQPAATATRHRAGVYDVDLATPRSTDANLGGARTILRLVAMHYPEAVSHAQLRTLAGISARTLTNYTSKIVTSGFARREGNGVVATPEGMAYLNGDIPTRPATTTELLEMWRPKLGGAYQLLTHVAWNRRRWTPQELQDACQISPRTYTNYASKLVTNGLAIRESGGLRASPTLFP